MPNVKKIIFDFSAKQIYGWCRKVKFRIKVVFQIGCAGCAGGSGHGGGHGGVTGLTSLFAVIATSNCKSASKDKDVLCHNGLLHRDENSEPATAR